MLEENAELWHRAQAKTGSISLNGRLLCNARGIKLYWLHNLHWYLLKKGSENTKIRLNQRLFRKLHFLLILLNNIQK